MGEDSDKGAKIKSTLLRGNVLNRMSISEAARCCFAKKHKNHEYSTTFFKEPVMKTRTSLILCVVAGLALAWATPAQAYIIYFDDFSGDGSSNLDGTTPDITPTGSETWTADGTWKDNGYNANWWDGNHFASLPFVPASGSVYTLSLSVLDADPYGHEGYNSDPVGITFDGGGPGIKFYDDGPQTVYTSGPLGDVSEGGYGSGAISVDIVLDTQPEAWEVEFFVNGDSVRGPEAYDPNPDITTIVIWKDWMCGIVDDLKLTPEPATLALLGLGGLGLLFGRKRR